MNAPAALRALVLLSGGLDSTVCMALATRLAEQARGRGPAATATANGGPVAVLALTFDYGQRHRIELERAAAVARHYGSELLVVAIDATAWGGSALTDVSIDVPSPAGGGAGDRGSSEADAADVDPRGIPVTYVPARNIIFLAVALGVAEARGLDVIWLGVNAVDYSGYPDCRPEFVDAFRTVATIGQKRGLAGNPVQIRTPLVDLAKADIVRLGVETGAPLSLTWSCYRGGYQPCGDCDACHLRAKGFAEAGVPDPAAPGR